MYIPPAFRVEDLETLHAFMRRYSFATLVTVADGEPFATHLPLLLDAACGPYGTLRGHVARANPQWRQLASGGPLAIFQGPHAYVSPSWYEAELAVPTWNYTAVHAYGAARLIEDADELLALVRELTAVYEAPRPEPWRMDLPEDWLRNLARGIVGFELEITRLEGKWKLSQNRPEEDRERVAAALSESKVVMERATGKLMRRMSGCRKAHTDGG